MRWRTAEATNIMGEQPFVRGVAQRPPGGLGGDAPWPMPGASHMRDGAGSPTQDSTVDCGRRAQQLAGGVAVETLYELDERCLRDEPATTDLNAAQLSSTDEFERGGPSDAKTFHHFFNRVQSSAWGGCRGVHALSSCVYLTQT